MSSDSDPSKDLPSADADIAGMDDQPTILDTRASASRAAEPAGLSGANPDAPVPFVFGQRIAQGAMGAILEADDCKLGRKIAVKVMLSEAGMSDEQKLRFIQEAAVLGKLEHPNIVPVHDLGRDAEGELYYSMKLVQGRTLQDIVNELRGEDPDALAHYTLDRLLTIFRKICDAMAFSHSQNIIHRDLKPENIMVGEFGEVLVMDWGLSKILDGSAELPGPQSHSLDPREDISASSSVSATLEGSVMGTPQYMSPEQAAGEIAAMDSRSDIYSLGGILYTILTLRPPVEDKDVYKLLEKVQAGELTPITSFAATKRSGEATQQGDVLEAKKIKPLPHIAGGRVPPALSAVAMKALALENKDRYQDVGVFSEDVEKWQGGFATSAERAGFGTQLLLLIKRNKGIFTTGFTAWLLITALAVWFVFNLRAKERRAIAGERSAEQREAEAIEARADAESQKSIAEKQRAVAVENERLLARELTSQYVDRSLEEAAAESWQSALWWAGEAYRVARESGALSEAEEVPHRYRIAALIDRLPKMYAVPELEGPSQSEIAWNPDGAWAAIGLEGGVLQIFDPETWSTRSTFSVPKHDHWIKKLFPLGEGRILICYGNNECCVADLQRAPEEAVILERSPEKFQWVNSAFAVSPERGYFAALSSNGWLRTWDLESGKLLARNRLLEAKSAKTILAASPDRSALAVAIHPTEVGRERDKRLFLLDPRTHRELGVVEENAPFRFFFTPDGRYLLHPVKGGEFVFRDVSNGLAIKNRKAIVMNKDLHYFNRFEFSGDGKTIRGMRDGRLHFFSIGESGENEQEKQARTLNTGHFLVSPDERILAGSPWGGNPTVRMWDAHTYDPLGTPLELAGQLGDLRFSPDGSILAVPELTGERIRWSSTDRKRHFRLWRTDAHTPSHPVRAVNPTVLPRRKSGSPTSRAAAFSSNGEFLLTRHPNRRHSILTWDARRLIPLQSIDSPTGEGNLICFGFSGTGERIYAAWSTGVVAFFDPVTGTEIQPRIFHGGEPLRWAEVSANGKVLVTSHSRNLGEGRKESAARVWSLPGGKMTGEVRSPRNAGHRLSPDGSLAFLYLAGGEKVDHIRGLYRVAEDTLHRIEKVNVLDFAEGTRFADRRGTRFLRDNRWLLNANVLHQVEADGFTRLRRFGGRDAPGGSVELAIDPREERAAIAVTGRRLGIYHLDTGELTVPYLDHDSDLSRVCFSPDGNLLATGTVEGKVEIRDSHSGKAVFPAFQVDTTGVDYPFKIGDPALSDLHFSGDGSRLLIADAFGGVYLWELPDPKDLDAAAVETLASLAGNRIIGGEEHGRRMLGEEWHALWRETPEEVRDHLLLDRESDGGDGQDGPWIELFDGKSLDGWATFDGDFSRVAVEDGTIATRGDGYGGGWLFYTGSGAGDETGSSIPIFRDFEWRAMVKTTEKGNSGFRFHASGIEKGPSGIEIDITGSDGGAPTGSVIWARSKEEGDHVPTLGPHPADGEWFEYRVRVEGKTILAWVNDRLIQSWTQPEDWTPRPDHPKTRIGMGTFAIQLNNEGVWLKDIRVRRLGSRGQSAEQSVEVKSPDETE